jgi:hypothetical protein
VFYNFLFVYGLRKVILGKEVLILSGKNLIVLTSNKKNYLFNIGSTFYYKFIILNIKREQNIFLGFFLKYWSSSCDFNKLVIKAKMHTNTYFLNFFLYENMM